MRTLAPLSVQTLQAHVCHMTRSSVWTCQSLTMVSSFNKKRLTVITAREVHTAKMEQQQQNDKSELLLLLLLLLLWLCVWLRRCPRLRLLCVGWCRSSRDPLQR